MVCGHRTGYRASHESRLAIHDLLPLLIWSAGRQPLPPVDTHPA
jgi:hypothetical protein